MARRTGYLRTSTILIAMAAAALVAVLVSFNNPASAKSTTIKVNTIEDESNTDGDCSLREAIEAANTNAAVDGCKAGSATKLDAIKFSLGEQATIELGSTLPAINNASGLTIDGKKAQITVSGNDTVRVFVVNSGAKLTLANLTVADGNVSGVDGGGIFNDRGTLTVTNSTFSGNSANFGGGISNFGALTVSNSTFSGNSASGSASSVGGGIFNGFETTATLRNTIVANSPSGGNCFNDQGTLTDGGYNIDDGTTCGLSAANNSKPSTDPLLDTNGLQNNGGPTQTIQLLTGSPALNAIPKGTNGCGTEIKKDQRGVKRPLGSGCDIGAVEQKGL